MSKLHPWFTGAWIISGVIFALLTIGGLSVRFWPAPAEQAGPTQTASIEPEHLAIGNGITILNSGTLNLQINDFGSAQINRLSASDGTGAQVDLEFVLLHSSAIWAFGSDSSFIRPNGTTADLNRFLVSDQFQRRLASYSDIICLGTASNASEQSITATIPLSRDRAIRLCRLVQATTSRNDVRVSAIGLGYHTVAARKNSTEERAQRAAVLVGVERISGNPDLTAIVRQLMTSGSVEGFDFRPYSGLIDGQPLVVDQVTSQAIAP